MLDGLWQLQGIRSAAGRHQKEQEATDSEKKRLANLIEHLHVQVWRDGSTEEVWEIPESLAKMISKDLSLYEVSP